MRPEKFLAGCERKTLRALQDRIGANLASVIEAEVTAEVLGASPKMAAQAEQQRAMAVVQRRIADQLRAVALELLGAAAAPAQDKPPPPPPEPTPLEQLHLALGELDAVLRAWEQQPAQRDALDEAFRVRAQLGAEMSGVPTAAGVAQILAHLQAIPWPADVIPTEKTYRVILRIEEALKGLS